MGCTCDNCGCTGSENVVQIIGQKGDTGAAGATPTINAGTTTTLPPGENAVVSLVPEGNNVYRYDFSIPEGADGTNGTNGTNGWTPILAVITDGERRVLRIYDWTGGSGTKPSTVDQYIGATGIVSTAAAAVDIRGSSAAASGASQPIGSSMEYGGVSDPNPVTGEFSGATWMIEDGRELSRSTYYILFNIIGTRFGAGNGTTTFNIPNSYGRVTVGFDTTSDFNQVGKIGGAKTKTILASNLPVSPPWLISQTPHEHSVNSPNSFIKFGGSGLGVNPSGIPVSVFDGLTVTGATANVSMADNLGGGQALGILPPYIVKYKIIRVL